MCEGSFPARLAQFGGLHRVFPLGLATGQNDTKPRGGTARDRGGASPRTCRNDFIAALYERCPRWKAARENKRTTFEVFIKQLRCNWNLTVHNGAYLFILLFSFQLSFFLLSKLGLFLVFLFAFILLSFVTHIWCSFLEKFLCRTVAAETRLWS